MQLSELAMACKLQGRNNTGPKIIFPSEILSIFFNNMIPAIKLFNKILDTRLDDFLEKHKIINDCQIGFTRKARSSDHMFILKCLIDKYCWAKDGRLFASFVDFRKAFDTVIHTGIKIKLLNVGIGSLFYNIVKNMYNLSQSCVRIKKEITNFFPN